MCSFTCIYPFKCVWKFWADILVPVRTFSSGGADRYICTGRLTMHDHLTLLPSKRPKLYTVLAFLGAIGLRYLDT